MWTILAVLHINLFGDSRSLHFSCVSFGWRTFLWKNAQQFIGAKQPILYKGGLLWLFKYKNQGKFAALVHIGQVLFVH